MNKKRPGRSPGAGSAHQGDRGERPVLASRLKHTSKKLNHILMDKKRGLEVLLHFY